MVDEINKQLVKFKEHEEEEGDHNVEVVQNQSVIDKIENFIKGS